jgi:hypothetical protein
MSHHTINLANVKAIVAEIVASHDVKSVAFVGCGASSSELYPGYYFLKDAARTLRPFHFTASEFNQDTPAWVDESAAVITCSLGGTTPEAVEANHVAKSLGATVIAVTHAAGSALTEEADYSIVHGFELNYAAKIEKMGYVIALAVELLQQTEGYEHYDAMLDGFDRIFDLAESAANHAKGFAADFGRQFKDDPLIYYMSSGASLDVAYSSSICLMMEMQWVNSGSFHSGEYFHGPFEITDKDVPFVLFMNDGKTRKADARALTFLNRFDAKVAVVDTKDYGLSSEIAGSVVTYFNPMLHTAVFRTYAEALSEERNHPLTVRRYMWKLEY